MPTYKEQKILDKVYAKSRDRNKSNTMILFLFSIFNMKKIFSIVSPPTFHLAPRSLDIYLCIAVVGHRKIRYDTYRIFHIPVNELCYQFITLSY